MNSSLKKYDSFNEMKRASIVVKPKVKREVLQEELFSFFKNLKQVSISNSKSRFIKRATRNNE